MPRKSNEHGVATSDVEVTNISAHGLWMLISGKELFLQFELFPWFRNAPSAEIFNVEQPRPGHLYWPGLDIDLAVESIEAPEKFPLAWSERASNSRRKG